MGIRERILAAKIAYKNVLADETKKNELRRWVKYGKLDYQLLQDLVNACPDDVEMTIGPLQDGTTIKLRRVYDAKTAAKAVPDYRSNEAKFQGWIEDLRKELGR